MSQASEEAKASAEAAAQSAEDAQAAAELAQDAAASVAPQVAEPPACNVVTTVHQGVTVTGCSICRAETLETIEANPRYGEQCMASAKAAREALETPNREEAAAPDRSEG